MLEFQTERLIPFQNQFLKNFREKGKSENSLKCYRLDFECFNSFISQHRNVDFNDYWLGEFEHFLEKKYSSINSRRRKLQTLRLFFDFLVAKKLFPENPIKKIASAPKSLLPPAPTQFPVIFYAFQFLEKQISQAETQLQELVARRNLILFTLIYEAGITVAPLSKIKRNQVHLDKQEIRVLVIPKKRDPYSIPISLKYYELFEEYFRLYDNVLHACEKDIDDLFFFANSYKIIRGTLSPRGIEEVFQKISKGIGDTITPKSLRQSCIVKWLVEKHPEATMKEWLGLAPSYSMQLYNKYIQDQKEQTDENKDFLGYKNLYQ